MEGFFDEINLGWLIDGKRFMNLNRWKKGSLISFMKVEKSS